MSNKFYGIPEGCKRMYLPGIKLKSYCPECGTRSMLDMTNNYPFERDKETYATFECRHCDDFYEMPVKIEITVTCEE